MPPKLKFQEGEKVLCYHGPLIYEAKCMKGQTGKDKDKAPKFFIHYNGWNKNWDEWVPEQRVLKFTEANLQKQKDLIQQHKKEGKEKKGKRKIEGGIGRGYRKGMISRCPIHV
jgi:mortality factor 4-like protein 1